MSDPRILLISSYPPAWRELAAITCASHKAYADRHGYDYVADCSDLSGPKESAEWGAGADGYMPIRGFVKLDLMLHYMDPESCRREYDYVAWLDADLLITNFDVPFTHFITPLVTPRDTAIYHGDVVLPFDANGHNATVMIARCASHGAYDLLWASNNAGRTMFIRHGWAEMEAMRYFLQTPPYSFAPLYLSIKQLCPMPPDTYPIPERVRKKYEWEPGDWSIHFSALSLDRRIALAKEYAAKCPP